MTRNKARLPCSDLNAGSPFISKEEGKSEFPVKTLKKAIVPRSSRQKASQPVENLRGMHS